MGYSITEFCLNDEMMKEFYNDYIVEKLIPTKQEALINLRFFAVMSIQCSEVELDSLGKIFSKRLYAYFFLIQKIGYRYGKKLSKSSEPGLFELLRRAFYKVEVR